MPQDSPMYLPLARYADQVFLLDGAVKDHCVPVLGPEATNALT